MIILISILIIYLEKDNGKRYLELTGANLHIASLDLEDATSQWKGNGNGYVREEESVINLTKNRNSLRSFQSDEMSMYTANEFESENEEYTINSDSFSCSFSESDGTASESQQSPRKKKRWYFF